ncbi:FAR1 DNA-binding domain [Sesbania bispinosa]|nr:FAR1 DNA-binding domain [Sesbania bispinosa]
MTSGLTGGVCNKVYVVMRNSNTAPGMKLKKLWKYGQQRFSLRNCSVLRKTSELVACEGSLRREETRRELTRLAAGVGDFFCCRRKRSCGSGRLSSNNRDESRNGDGNPVGDQGGLSWGGRMIHELTHDDIRRLEFGSEGEAYSFYSDYAKQRGFAVRKDDIERNENGDIVKRYLVCNKEGTRDKKHLERKDRVKEARPITRVQCTTRMRVYLDMRSGKWKVSAFHDDHNHELTPPTYVHMMSAYRRLSESDKAQIDTLHAAGVRTCHIMSFMIGQKGGHGELGKV